MRTGQNRGVTRVSTGFVHIGVPVRKRGAVLPLYVIP